LSYTFTSNDGGQDRHDERAGAASAFDVGEGPWGDQVAASAIMFRCISVGATDHAKRPDSLRHRGARCRASRRSDDAAPSVSQRLLPIEYTAQQSRSTGE